MSRIEAVTGRFDPFMLESAVTDLVEALPERQYFVREATPGRRYVSCDDEHRVFVFGGRSSAAAGAGASSKVLLEWLLGVQRRPLSSYFEGLCNHGSSIYMTGEEEMDSPSLSIGRRATSELRLLPGVSVRRGAEVEDVLAALGLTRVAVSTVTALQRYFPDAELIVDRERPENEAGLIRIDVVPAPGGHELADELLDRFDEDWWLKQSSSVRSRIGVYVA